MSDDLTAADVWVAWALGISVENAPLIQGKTRARVLSGFRFKGGTFTYWTLRGCKTGPEMMRVLEG